MKSRGHERKSWKKDDDGDGDDAEGEIHVHEYMYTFFTSHMIHNSTVSLLRPR